MDILDTPGTTSIPMKFAGFWIRFAAYIIDAIVVSIVNYGLMFTFFAGMFKNSMNGGGAPLNINYGLFGTYYIIIIVLNWLYFALMESSANQGTLGKMAVGVIVTDLEGNKISFARATGRFFSKIISTLILCIGFIMVGLTEKKQGLHDKIAETFVINKR